MKSLIVSCLPRKNLNNNDVAYGRHENQSLGFKQMTDVHFTKLKNLLVFFTYMYVPLLGNYHFFYGNHGSQLLQEVIKLPYLEDIKYHAIVPTHTNVFGSL
jgi:hypothetical protein